MHCSLPFSWFSSLIFMLQNDEQYQYIYWAWVADYGYCSITQLVISSVYWWAYERSFKNCLLNYFEHKIMFRKLCENMVRTIIVFSIYIITSDKRTIFANFFAKIKMLKCFWIIFKIINNILFSADIVFDPYFITILQKIIMDYIFSKTPFFDSYFIHCIFKIQNISHHFQL